MKFCFNFGSIFLPRNYKCLFEKLILVSLLVISGPVLANAISCEAHLDLHMQDQNKNKNLLGKEIAAYQSLIEESFVYRSRSIEFAKQIKAKIKNEIPLSGADLQILNQGLITYLDLRKRLYRYAMMHECWIDAIDANTRSAIKPLPRLTGLMISLSAALTLYDNYLLAVSIYEEDTKLRRFLNSGDRGYKKGYAELAAVTLSYNSINNRARVRKVMKFYEKQRKRFAAVKHNDQYDYLNILIAQSPSYKLTRRFSPFRVLKHKVRFLDAMTGDTLVSLQKEGINIFSMVFGNTVGLIGSRKGKLYNNKTVISKVRNQLKAGDILLEKTPFRLTDKFIPGHWGHAAIWIGSEDELKVLGIWQNPLVKKYHKQIRRGNSVVEALRSGVVMSPLKQFMNIDDLGMLRVHGSQKKNIANIILLALRQVGKEYDFNFDVESSDKIVCSELIYITYTDITWPTENTLGRYTISPDNVAVKALKNGPLDVVMLVHDGKIIERHPDQYMAVLLKADSR